MPFPMFLHLNVAETLLQPSKKLTRYAERIRQEKPRVREIALFHKFRVCSWPRLMRGRPWGRAVCWRKPLLWLPLPCRLMQVRVTVGCKQWQAVARKRNGNGRRNLACRQTQWWPRQIDNGSGASVAEVNKP